MFSGSLQPYAEDTWQTLSIGSVAFSITGTSVPFNLILPSDLWTDWEACHHMNIRSFPRCLISAVILSLDYDCLKAHHSTQDGGIQAGQTTLSNRVFRAVSQDQIGRQISGLALCGEHPVACRPMCQVRNGVHRSGSWQEGRARASAHACSLQAQARPHSLWCLAGSRTCQSWSRDAAGGCTCKCTGIGLRSDQGRLSLTEIRFHGRIRILEDGPDILLHNSWDSRFMFQGLVIPVDHTAGPYHIV